MGQYAKKLRRRIVSMAGGLPAKEPKRPPGGLLAGDIKDVETLIKEGHDPIHAAYIYMQNFTSCFAEGVSQFPEMRAWADVVSRAEEEYLPSGPPMSPLTGSYFWTWAIYDLRIGKSTDTLASCQIAVNDVLPLNSRQLDAAKKLSASRMGIYEHVSSQGPHLLLRELITDDQFPVHCPTGYRGQKGELWYVRLVPPLESEVAQYWVAMTTPYILPKKARSDWTAFLKRTMPHCAGADDRTQLHNLLKFGLDPHYWNEFVVKAYHRPQQDAIFLTGIPDIEATLPHA